MDVKLRSLVCLGLNEQVLHLWWETLCSAPASLRSWYSPHSLAASPGWVLVKCELRILAQFSFNLSHDWELPQRWVGNQGQVSLSNGLSFSREDETLAMKEGVREMLVKHHLFSWNT